MSEFWHEIIHNFHFLRPWVLLFLLFPAGMYFFTSKKSFIASSWEKVCDKNLLNFLLVKGTGKQRGINGFWGYLFLISSIFAAAGPAWVQNARPAIAIENPVMFLLNLSSDMRRNDVGPDRLTRAKVDITTLLAKLENIEGGLIVYTAEPFLISPLSNDKMLIQNLLPALNADIMPVNGDRLDRAIDLAVEKMHGAGYGQGNIVIIAAEAGTDFAQALNSAQHAQSNRIRVNAVDVGPGVNQQFSQLTAVGGGIAVGDSSTSIAKLAATINNSANAENLRESGSKIPEWLDYGWYFLIIPMLCCLYFFRKGTMFFLFVIFFSFSAQAGFFINDNQEAMRDFDRGDYREAAQKFKNKAWKASSLYRAGNYTEAAAMFDAEKDIESLYNQGNAYAKSGKFEEAIKLYEKVLQENPGHEDAKFNLEYLKQQQQQNQQQPENQENSKENQDKQQNSQNQNNTGQGQQKDSQETGGEQNQNEEPQRSEDSNSGSDAEPSQQENNSPENDNSQNDSSGVQNSQSQKREQENAAMPSKEGDKSEKYDETAQAREQRFREIPEDSGGLLRAFIRKEYLKNRYGGVK